MNVQQLLTSWEIDADVIQKFIENGIETSHFKDLSDEILKELCPKISARIYIKKQIGEYLTAESKTSTVSSLPSCSQDSLASEVDLNLDENFLLDILSSRPPFPEFDLKTLLSTSPTGNCILQYYATHNTLSPKHRNNLTDIICRRIFTRVVNHRINYEEYNILTSKIIALFPTENAGTYFVPPVKKRDSICGKPAFAKGKLVDKIRNTLFKSGERKRKIPEKENVDHKRKKNTNITELQDTLKDDVVWLKNNTEPWDDVIKKWKATHELRQLTQYDTVEGFIANWPILNDVRSDVLIHLDFEAIYPEKSNKFHLFWDEFIEKVKNIKKHQNSKEETAALVEYIDGLVDTDHKLPSQIDLLCHLVPPKGRLNKREKFSIKECSESFIVNVKTPGDIQKKIEEISSTASGKQKTVQPYIIHCTSEDFDGTFYLIIDKVRYVYKSAYKAFDTLFKCFHALHIAYPKSGYHLFLLIQICVYNINTKYDVIPPYIMDLISNAKC